MAKNDWTPETDYKKRMTAIVSSVNTILTELAVLQERMEKQLKYEPGGWRMLGPGAELAQLQNQLIEVADFIVKTTKMGKLQ